MYIQTVVVGVVAVGDGLQSIQLRRQQEGVGMVEVVVEPLIVVGIVQHRQVQIVFLRQPDVQVT